MNTVAAAPGTSVTVTKRMKVGLALAVLLGLANIPFLFSPTPDGQDGPPYAVLVLSAVLGAVSVVAAVIAWRSGSRTAIRVAAATVIINAVTTIPALFADIDAGIKVVSAVTILVSVAAAVLILGRPSQSAS
jgi:hypothetical protein